MTVKIAVGQRNSRSFGMHWVGLYGTLVADGTAASNPTGGVGTMNGGFLIKSPRAWTTTSTMGTLDTNGTVNVYIEDSTFINVSQWPDIDDNGRMVMRHCVLDGTWGLTHGFTSNWAGGTSSITTTRSRSRTTTGISLEDISGYAPGPGYSPTTRSRTHRIRASGARPPRRITATTPTPTPIRRHDSLGTGTTGPQT